MFIDLVSEGCVVVGDVFFVVVFVVFCSVFLFGVLGGFVGVVGVEDSYGLVVFVMVVYCEVW